MPDIAAYALPPLYAVLLWWFSTGLILWLSRLSRRRRPLLLLTATAALGLALAGVAVSAEDTGEAGAYHAFAAALVVWGWHELTFLLGLVTGPRKTALDVGATGTRRFLQATAAIAYHEAALAATAILLVAVTWGAPNQIAAWTFLALWVLRLSAKLNLFLGVPHFGDELMPDRLQHLRSYFVTRAMNALFPVSVTVITAAAALLLARAWHPAAAPYEIAGLTALATLLALGALEHWFMVLPIRDAALWRWAAARSGATGPRPGSDGQAPFESRPAPATSSG